MRFHAVCIVVVAAFCLTGARWSRARAAETPLPPLDQVLAKFVAASGGEQAIREKKSRMMKGTLSSPLFGDAKWELFAKAPDKVLTVTEIPGLGAMTDGCDGRVAWMSNPMVGTVERQGEEASRSVRDATFDRDLRFKELYPGLTLVGAGQLEEEATWIVEAKTPAGSLDRFQFSQATGRLMKHHAEFTGQSGPMKTETTFDDFRVVDGLAIPHRIGLIIWGGDGSELKLEVKLDEVKHDVAIDDARFTKPAA